MASVNAPRGLALAKKNGSGSNSTGIRTIDLTPASPKVASALIPSDIFTGDPIMIESQGTIKPCPANVTVKCAGVFQGIQFVNASGEQKFARSFTGGTTATDDKIHIARDPGQTFFVQADATVTASAGVGTVPVNCNIATGTGSHKTGQSAMVLDADTPVLTQSQLRVIRRAPWDTGIGASAGVTDAYPWFEVYLNNSNDRFQSTSVCST